MPISYPADGFCSQGGVSWAWCEDFDGQGVSAKAAFVPANSGIAFNVHSHETLQSVGCDTSIDCTPYVQGGSLFL
ncbi:MAG TPA: hypothetical protein VMI75_21520, partial [Polyangiaceae bacterium]|nr:hypothetical protein [Polyangiaceae bacterium]